jgi:hypothetical protein
MRARRTKDCEKGTTEKFDLHNLQITQDKRYKEMDLRELVGQHNHIKQIKLFDTVTSTALL